MAALASVTAYEGPCFVLLDRSGDVPFGQEHGLYYEDTRFLCLHTLRLDDRAPIALAAHLQAPHLSVHWLTNPELERVPRGSLVLRRTYGVSHGAHCDLDIENHASQVASFDLVLAYDADFADVFEIKRSLEVHATRTAEAATAALFGRSVLALSLAGRGFRRRTEVRFSKRPELDGRTARFHIELAPRGHFHLCQDLYTIAEGDFIPPRRLCSQLVPLEELEESAIEAPPAHAILESDSQDLSRAFERAVVDLYALRVRSAEAPGEFHLGAGVPWFMALFGRDSLIAAFQSLVFLPELARGVLRSLAHWQGVRFDPETEEQPGKILHETRPATLLGARSFVPRFPYYGSVDSTPLFLVVLSEFYRRTGDFEMLRALEPNMVGAVEWILRACQAHGGFLGYRRSTEYGLVNQGWKDSEDSIRFRDGRFGAPPICLVEAQGYAVDALRRAGELYAALGRTDAAPLVARAEELAQAIDRSFWLEDRDYFALALDGANQRVDALTSNPAHLLWSGAAREERVDAMARALVSPELFSGFGVRTMGSAECAYNPVAYHNGSVWPHDTAIAAAGLARYGRRREAAILCRALLDAASHQDLLRLPELFAGLSREEAPYPVPYPTANSPQAWAAGALLMIATVLLGLRVDALAKRIVVAPTLPDSINWIRLRGLAIAGASVAIEVRREASGEVVGKVSGEPPGWSVSRE